MEWREQARGGVKTFLIEVFARTHAGSEGGFSGVLNDEFMYLLCLPMRRLPEALNPKYPLRHRLIGQKPTLLSLYILDFHNIPCHDLSVIFVTRGNVWRKTQWSCYSAWMGRIQKESWASVEAEHSSKCHNINVTNLLIWLGTYKISIPDHFSYFRISNPRFLCNLRLLDSTVCLKNTVKNIILWNIITI